MLQHDESLAIKSLIVQRQIIEELKKLNSSIQNLDNAIKDTKKDMRKDIKKLRKNIIDFTPEFMMLLGEYLSFSNDDEPEYEFRTPIIDEALQSLRETIEQTTSNKEDEGEE